MKSEFIRLDDISKSFYGVKALSNVSVTINRGEAYCLAGENGSGKSTLIKIIAGVYSKDNGSIYVDGNVVHDMNPNKSMDLGVQIIYQDFSLFPNLTVAENIAYYNQIVNKRKRVDWNNIESIAKEALDQLNLKIDLNKLVGELTVAERQLVAIARAITQDAKLLIMDEPTTTLTNVEIDALFEIVRDLKSRGISILFISHKLDEVFKVSEKIIILRNGKKVAEGNIEDFDNDKVSYYMTGREITSEGFGFDGDTDDLILSVKDLNKEEEYSDINFDLSRGEVLGITGLLGSGRTKLANSLFGVSPADSGTLVLNGETISIDSVQDAIDHKIAYVPEDRITEGLFLQRSIGNNIISTIVDKFKRKFGIVDEKEEEKEILSWIDKLKIKVASHEKPVRSLSGGNQQRVVIARALATNPEVLILNCPTVGVDVGSKEEIHKIIRELAKQNIGVIVISDDIPELLQTCNRVLIMKKGRITNEVKISDCDEAHIQELMLS
ncbi:sugar ABC transporter ATP-binding protein [Mycoplasmatota bacterium]|nr:sugar ABC transporter ATP-binding protein [Mycoplasmatota bacterium]